MKIFKYFFRIISSIPTINPSNRLKLLWDIIESLILLYLFFIIPTMISFALEEKDIFYEFMFEIVLLISFCNIFVKLNTGFYKRGVLCKKRSSIWRKYYYEQLSLDLWSFFPFLIYLFLKHYF